MRVSAQQPFSRTFYSTLYNNFNLYCADFDQLNSLLNSVDWEEALRDLNINNAWKYFSSMFNTFIMECIPMSVPKRKKNLYITREAKSLKNKWNRLWKDTSDLNLILTT